MTSSSSITSQASSGVHITCKALLHVRICSLQQLLCNHANEFFSVHISRRSNCRSAYQTNASCKGRTYHKPDVEAQGYTVQQTRRRCSRMRVHQIRRCSSSMRARQMAMASRMCCRQTRSWRSGMCSTAKSDEKASGCVYRQEIDAPGRTVHNNVVKALGCAYRK